VLEKSLLPLSKRNNKQIRKMILINLGLMMMMTMMMMMIKLIKRVVRN
jgi:hypothetical protein